MKKLSGSDKIYIKNSKILNAGRGVFAERNIKKGELIEKCPVIELPEHDMSSLRQSLLVTYFFYFGKKKERLALALGFGSLYNHTYNPNARYEIRDLENTIDFIALNNIKKNDEITVDYNSANPTDKTPFWFEVPNA